jgi:hypothetical protein
MSQTQAQETLTPFTLPLPFNILSQLRTPLKKFSHTASPRIVQPHTQDQPHASQPLSSANLRDDSEGRDTLAAVIQRMQERLVVIEEHLSGENVPDRNRQRLRRISTTRGGEDPFEAQSDGPSDVPPSYRE